jgi:hypothetical protein
MFDFVLINWLMMYLDDAQARAFMREAVKSRRRACPGGGRLLVHESCWDRSSIAFRSKSGARISRNRR